MGLEGRVEDSPCPGGGGVQAEAGRRQRTPGFVDEERPRWCGSLRKLPLSWWFSSSSVTFSKHFERLTSSSAILSTVLCV